MKNKIIAIIIILVALLVIAFFVKFNAQEQYLAEFKSEEAVNISALEPLPVSEENGNFYLPATEVPFEMPFSDVAMLLKADENFDVSVYQYNDEKKLWDIIAVDVERNVTTGVRKSPVYYDDVIEFTVFKDSTDFQNRVAYENQSRMESNLYQLETPGAIGEIDFFGTNWKYFDFQDFYDGGFIRRYFYERDGQVISFGVSDDMIKDNPDIRKLPKVDYLKNIVF